MKILRRADSESTLRAKSPTKIRRKQSKETPTKTKRKRIKSLRKREKQEVSV